MSTAIATANEPTTLRAMLEAARPKLADVLPAHLTPEWMTRVTLVAVSRNPKLAECTPQSILQCVMVAGQLGLDPSGVSASGYLVPFWNNREKRSEAQFVPGYQGLIDLARRTGEVLKIEARPVYEGEHFKCFFGTEPRIEHEPNFDDKRPLRLVYAVAFFRSGVTQFEVMTAGQIDALAAAAKEKARGRDTTWDKHYDEMARKSPVRRLSKYLPKSPEFSRALELQALAEGHEQADYRAMGFEMADAPVGTTHRPRFSAAPDYDFDSARAETHQKLAGKAAQIEAAKEAQAPLAQPFVIEPNTQAEGDSVSRPGNDSPVGLNEQESASYTVVDESGRTVLDHSGRPTAAEAADLGVVVDEPVAEQPFDYDHAVAFLAKLYTEWRSLGEEPPALKPATVRKCSPSRVKELITHAQERILALSSPFDAPDDDDAA